MAGVKLHQHHGEEEITPLDLPNDHKLLLNADTMVLLKRAAETLLHLKGRAGQAVTVSTSLIYQLHIHYQSLILLPSPGRDIMRSPGISPSPKAGEHQPSGTAHTST